MRYEPVSVIGNYSINVNVHLRLAPQGGALNDGHDAVDSSSWWLGKGVGPVDVASFLPHGWQTVAGVQDGVAAIVVDTEVLIILDPAKLPPTSPTTEHSQSNEAH